MQLILHMTQEAIKFEKCKLQYLEKVKKKSYAMTG